MTQLIAPHRRHLLLGAGAVILTACSPQASSAQDSRFANSPFRRIGDAEWRRRLGDASWRVLRHEHTERPFTSPLDDENRRGTFVCKGCELPLFRSAWKYDSRTGWPSFTQAMRQNIGTKTDYLIGVPRTEYHCAQCLGHQGHLFDDGPAPRGERWCNNGLALEFIPA